MKIKHALKFAAALLLLSTLNAQRSTVFAQGTAFTYQGQFQNNGNPASGSYDLEFYLYNTNVGGTVIAGPVITNGVIVSNGLFTVPVDFGAGVFIGQTNWLQIEVKTNGFPAFTTLTPRQQLTPAPYAIYAEGANAAGLSGAIANGNLPANPAFSGTVTAPSFQSDVNGDFDAGGNSTASGGNSTVGGGRFNTASGGVATVSGGQQNNAGSYATVGGGLNNTASGTYSTVGGGGGISTAGNTAGGQDSTVGGGQKNNASGANSTVSGGIANTASGQTGNATATVGGGYNNTASGDWSTVPGGSGNTASGKYSFAAGQQAQALHQGAFVWADSQSGTFSSTTNDQFLIRAAGGVGIGTASPQQGLSVNTGMNLDQANLNAGLLNNGNTNGSGLTFGSSSGEGIASQRATGGNHNGLDFYTSYTPRMSIFNNGNVSINGHTLLLEPSTAGSYANDGLVWGNGGLAGSIVNSASAPFLAGFWGGSLGALNPNILAFSWDSSGNCSVNNNLSSSSLTFRGTSASESLTMSGAFLTVSGGATLGGNLGIGETNPVAPLHILGPSNVPPGALNASDNGLLLGTTGTSGYKWIQSYGGALVLNYAGNNVGIGTTNPAYKFDVNGDINASGSVRAQGVALTSDRNAKENFTAVNAREVLAKVAALPVTEWNFKTDSKAVQHLGPMAQDFQAAFGLDGADDKHISVIDEGGVALAAIQGLNQKVEEQRSQLEQKQTEITELKARLEKLEHLVNQNDEVAK